MRKESQKIEKPSQKDGEVKKEESESKSTKLDLSKFTPGELHDIKFAGATKSLQREDK